MSIITENIGPTITYRSKYHAFSSVNASIIGLSANEAIANANNNITIKPKAIRYFSKSAFKNDFIVI